MANPRPGAALPTDHLPSDRSDAESVEVALAASGDTHAFERLYRAHVARVHTLARRMLGEEHADEVTQDIFVRAWQKLATYRGEAAFGTWLHRLGVNVVLARREELGKRRRRFLEDDGVLAAAPGRHDSPELSVDFEAAIERLPPGAREVFVLHDVEGYRHEEIAGLLGVAVGTSKSQLHHARMALRRHLSR